MLVNKQTTCNDDERIPPSAFMAVNLCMFSAGMQFMLVLPMALPITMLLKNSYSSEFVDERKGTFMSLIIAIPYMSGAIGCMIWGHLSDRYGRRSVMLISLSAAFTAMIICAFSTSYTQFAVGRALSGLFDSTLFISKAIIGDATNSKTQTKRFSDIMAWFAVSLAISPNFVRLLESGSASMPALLPCSVGALILALSLILFWLFVPETFVERKQTLVDLTEKASFKPNRGVIHSVLLYGFFAGGLFASESLVPLIVNESKVSGGFGYTKSEVIFVYTVQGIFYCLAQKFCYTRFASFFSDLIQAFVCAALALTILCPSSYMPTLLGKYCTHQIPLLVLCCVVAIRILFISLGLTAAIELVSNSSSSAMRGQVNAAAQFVAFTLRGIIGISIGNVYDVARSANLLMLPFIAVGVVIMLCALYAYCALPKTLNAPKDENNDVTPQNIDHITSVGFESTFDNAGGKS